MDTSKRRSKRVKCRAICKILRKSGHKAEKTMPVLPSELGLTMESRPGINKWYRKIQRWEIPRAWKSGA